MRLVHHTYADDTAAAIERAIAVADAHGDRLPVTSASACRVSEAASGSGRWSRPVDGPDPLAGSWGTGFGVSREDGSAKPALCAIARLYRKPCSRAG